VILQSSWLSFSNSALKLFIHSATKVVFPNPAGAEMRVNLQSVHPFNRSIKRGRDTSSGRAAGINNFVTKISAGMNKLYTASYTFSLKIGLIIVNFGAFYGILNGKLL
jgi:hypothetical protein